MSGSSSRRPHVVVANWRDGAHPDAGGAEVYAEQMAAALQRMGCRVTFAAAARPGDHEPSAVADVSRVLVGGRWSVYPRVAWWLLRHRSDIDAVVDCQNGIPFFAPLWVRRSAAVVCVVHHVHTDQFGWHFSAPVAAVGRWLEGPAARRVYGRRPAVAVSPSTARRLRGGLKWRGPILVVPNGAPPAVGPRDLSARAAAPRVVSVARFVVHKRLDLLVAAAQRLHALVPGVEVRLVGSGPEAAQLAALVAAAPADRRVELTGRVSEERLHDELDRAWLHVVTTAGEGWGLSVIEAAARGVPTLGFDVDGIRDSVRTGHTGWLVPDGGDLAEGIAAALLELAAPDRAAAMSRAAKDWAGEFSWADSAERLVAVVVSELDRRQHVARDRRAVTDDSWVIELAAESGAVDRVPAQLRRTDRSGTWHGRHWMLLADCSRSGLVGVLTRIGRSDDVVAVRPATDEDLLRSVPLRTWAAAP